MSMADGLARLWGQRWGAIAAGDPSRIVPPVHGEINRAPSPILARLTPWLSIVLASVAPEWPFIALVPLMPPLGLLTLLGWRQLHPGLLPLWAGLPLGLIDDLVSGQPLGSGVLLWSVALLGLEAIELRWPWRNFQVDWAVAATVIAAYLIIGGLFANGLRRPDWLLVVLPQIVLAILLYPPVARMVAGLDRLRLTRFRATRFRTR